MLVVPKDEGGGGVDGDGAREGVWVGRLAWNEGEEEREEVGMTKEAG